MITIVVIAILAAISLIAYNGMQERAYAAKAASIVDSYVKIFEMYKVDHGKYPLQGESPIGNICLGTVSDFPAGGLFEGGDCYVDMTNGVPRRAKISEPLNSLLAPYASPLPASALPAIGESYEGGAWSLIGVLYYPNNTYDEDGEEVPGGAQFLYYMKKNQDCPRGNALYMGDDSGHAFDVTSCQVILDPGLTN